MEMFVNAHALESTKKLLKEVQKKLAEEQATGEVKRNIEIEKVANRRTKENIKAIFKCRDGDTK